MIIEKMTSYEIRNLMAPIQAGILFCDCCNSYFTFSALTVNLDEKKQPPFWQMGHEMYQRDLCKFCPHLWSAKPQIKGARHCLEIMLKEQGR